MSYRLGVGGGGKPKYDTLWKGGGGGMTNYDVWQWQGGSQRPEYYTHKKGGGFSLEIQ